MRGLRDRRKTPWTSSLGLSVLRVDAAETALAIARATADERAIEVERDAPIPKLSKIKRGHVLVLG